ncbi:MAG: sugar phosphate isomerase/epimerase [Ruminococcaceae bacterium]|nr:sugar phosphate isomerase/epimerase [Oscillospiraceae bacterium]
MWKTKLCLNILGNGVPPKEQLELFKKTGFEGFFISWREGLDLGEIREYADSLGLCFQSVHSPFLKAADMWRGGDRAAVALAEQLSCLEDVAAVGVKIMVCHTWIGFETGETPTESGVENYRILVERARELGVNIAFENTEGDEFLDTLMNAFKDYENVGFCLDTGHEMCYNRSKDLLAIYGDRLIATHINDNLGIKDYGGRITYLDDLHLLPFDGIKDWADLAKRLQKCGYDGELTFELSLSSHKGRHENDAYAEMPFERYLAEAYKRACRVAALVSQK